MSKGKPIVEPEKKNGLLTNVMSRGLDIRQVLFCVFVDRDGILTDQA